MLLLRLLTGALAAAWLAGCLEPADSDLGSGAPSAAPKVARVRTAAEPGRDEKSTRDEPVGARSVPDDDDDDCTRARREQGVLRGLRAYRFEQASERREIEQAILPDGIPVTIVYSGCHHSSAHYRFRLDSEPATQIGTNALEIAAQLMRSLADASASRGIGSLASKIAEAAAEGKYGLDDDVTGGYWEEYKAVGVSLESEPGSRVMVVKHHIVM